VDNLIAGFLKWPQKKPSFSLIQPWLNYRESSIDKNFSLF